MASYTVSHHHHHHWSSLIPIQCWYWTTMKHPDHRSIGSKNRNKKQLNRRRGRFLQNRFVLSLWMWPWNGTECVASSEVTVTENVGFWGQRLNAFDCSLTLCIISIPFFSIFVDGDYIQCRSGNMSIDAPKCMEFKLWTESGLYFWCFISRIISVTKSIDCKSTMMTNQWMNEWTICSQHHFLSTLAVILLMEWFESIHSLSLSLCLSEWERDWNHRLIPLLWCCFVI